MISISLCMIVKNEEQNLPACLDSLKDLVDEIVIADTGSTDRTKEIAASYEAKVYDFAWVDDFAAARNFVFSKATCDYIYSADADEVLDEENREKFRILKEAMDPAVDMVQMYYCNQLKFRTVYNYDRELRPKLFKRLRPFVWEDAIHEQVRLTPVIYDSDIEIDHRPAENHASRDLANFRMTIARGETITKRLHNLYARELFMAGTDEDFALAADFFRASCEDETRTLEEICDACCVVARAARIQNDTETFFKYAMKCIAAEHACSEILCELGAFYEAKGDTKEAVLWYYNALHEAEPSLVADYGDSIPQEALMRIGG